MKTEYNHGGALGISNIWQSNSTWSWANRAGEGCGEPSFEAAVTAAEAALQCDYCRGIQVPLSFMAGCTCGVSDAEFEEMWSAIVD